MEKMGDSKVATFLGTRVDGLLVKKLRNNATVQKRVLTGLLGTILAQQRMQLFLEKEKVLCRLDWR